MIAVDTNILVYAYRRDSPFHQAAFSAVRRLAEGAAPWAIPWPCIHEFCAVVTRAGVFEKPSTPSEAVQAIAALRGSPSLALISETHRHWDVLSRLIENGGVRGGRVHDARIAALCIAHGVGELWTADRDFSLFPALKTRNPLKG